MFFEDTICAIATASGVGALGIIRISGKEAIVIVSSMFKGKNLTKVASHTIHYGFITNKDNETIDEVMVSVFRAPKTFTAEDLVEISCHGSPYIQQQIINNLLENGARLATAGEFTQRAFLNGRIDLTQAEAVADLISSQNEASHRIALAQMKGGVSNKLKSLREQLIYFTAMLELELDFGEEDVAFANRDELSALLLEVQNKVWKLKDTFEYGNAIKNGVPVVIIGKPNAGKSTLLNAILNEDRAIVSEIPGTTRDTIEDTINIKGIDFRFIDTAGLRETDDIVENLGIERTLQKINEARVILYLFDKNDTSISEMKTEIAKLPPDKKLILVPTKTDLYPNFNFSAWITKLCPIYKPLTAFYDVNKNSPEKVDRLLNVMLEMIENDVDKNEIIISNIRHFEALQRADKALTETRISLGNNISTDLIAFHIKDAIRNIGEITGEIDIDKDILGTIFGKFCIGK